MTGKELKAFAEKISEEGIIEVNIGYSMYEWNKEFQIRAVLEHQQPTTELEEETVS